ncbi:MAG: glycoside hydrolase family 3 C-terminal domain-containing protein [Ktedonobacteraceae bacterium]|nr:glycoside hydrolase family 3 C-terminal domain-containing protein [Ktedonobacteraceae bacterium]
MQEYTQGMSLEEQIGQVISVGFHGLAPTPEIIDLIQKHFVGNVILFTRNIHSPQQVSELTQTLQRIARDAGHRHPLLISVDQENGMVRRLEEGVPAFPGNMALSAIDDEQLVYEVARATGHNLYVLGINTNLAPVLDINSNPNNPAIGVRSFGEDPQQVARFAAAAVKGYRASGIVAALKHFPGHGDTPADPHLSLPVIPRSLEQLEELELVPFRAGIAAGTESVMVSHMYMPGLMQQSIPTTVSREVVTDLLRKRLGFEGMVTTDCMEMKAVSDTIGTERAAVMALQAGVDMVLISHSYSRQIGSIEAIKAAIADGGLSPEVVRLAAEHVLRLKARRLSWDALTHPLGQEEMQAHRELGERAYALSTTLVRNDEGLLPLHVRPDQRVLLVFPRPQAYTLAVDKFMPYDVFEESVRRRVSQVTALTIHETASQEEYAQLDQAVREADLVITVTLNASIDPRQAEIFQRVLSAGRQTIGVAVYNPYDLLAFPQLQSYLVTYECTTPALEAAIRVLFGEVVAQGRLPVSLPGLYERGHRAR